MSRREEQIYTMRCKTRKPNGITVTYMVKTEVLDVEAGITNWARGLAAAGWEAFQKRAKRGTRQGVIYVDSTTLDTKEQYIVYEVDRPVYRSGDSKGVMRWFLSYSGYSESWGVSKYSNWKQTKRPVFKKRHVPSFMKGKRKPFEWRFKRERMKIVNGRITMEEDFGGSLLGEEEIAELVTPAMWAEHAQEMFEHVNQVDGN